MAAEALPDSSARRATVGRVFAEVALFLLPLLALGLAMEAGLRQVPNIYRVKARALEERGSSLEILVLGSSNALLGLAPASFHGATYNAANLSQPLYYDEQILRRYGTRMARLKLVVFALHPISLEYSLDGTPEYWRQYLYAREMGLPAEGPLDRFAARQVSLFALYGPWPSLSLARGGFRESLATIDADGWAPYPAQVRPIRDEDARARAAAHRAVTSQGRQAANEAHLRGAMRHARALGATPALVLMPVHPRGRAYVDGVKLAELRRVVQALAAELQAPVFDHFREDRLGTLEYVDVDHLTEAGARRFTGILDEELVRPVLGR